MSSVMKIKAKILNEGFDRQGRSRIAIWSDMVTIYGRKNGTFFFMDRGKRRDVHKRPDGSFYLATHEGQP